MEKNFGTFPTPGIEMPDQYKKHVEGVKTMTPDELSDKNITKEENFEMPPRMTGERPDFTEEDPDQKLIDAVNEIGNTSEEIIKEDTVIEKEEDFKLSSPESEAVDVKENPKASYRLAMQSYNDISRMISEYQTSKNTALEDKIRESIAETTKRFESIKDKNVNIQLGMLNSWEKLLPKKINEKF